MLAIDDLWVEAGKPDAADPIVKGVSIAVRRGEVLALIGESGAGKTTVGLAALGYERPGCRIVRGRVTLDGTDVLGLGAKARQRFRGRHIGFVAQSAAAAFNPAHRLADQICEGPTVHALMSAEAARRFASELCERLDLPAFDIIGRRYPHEVSGGQLQRLMAIMAMSCQPELLVLDEPTTALDVTTKVEVMKALKEITSSGSTSALYITHDLATAAQIAHRICVLHNGELIEEGPTRQIVERPQQRYTSTLIAAVRPLPKAQRQKAGDIAPVGEALPLLEVNHIVAAYDRPAWWNRGKLPSPALRGIDMKIGRGEAVAVIGESGSGKTTLARVIAGLLPPSSGQVKLANQVLASDIADRTKEEARRIQIVFQMPDTSLNPSRRVAQIIGRPLEYFHGSMSSQQQRRVSELLEMVELPTQVAGRYPEELSGGQKQRVALARALAAEPDLIICDEVTSALDPIVGAAILSLLHDLQERLGLALVFISHDLSTVAAIAERIVVLYAGRLVEEGPTGQILSPPFHPYTKSLIRSVPELRLGWLDELLAATKPIREHPSGVLSDNGCAYYGRCEVAIEGKCNATPPPFQLHAQHRLLCHRDRNFLMRVDHPVAQSAPSYTNRHKP